jgi:hypothetical protein
MKKQIITSIRTHPIRAAFLLLLPFLLGLATHEALAQRNTGKRSTAVDPSGVAPPATGAISGAYSVPAKPASNIPAIGHSQLPNDVNTLPATIRGGVSQSTAAPVGCPPIVINGSIDTGDPTQTDRLFRSGIPQTCPASTTCAVLGDGQPRHYDSYTFTNTTGTTQCVNIDTNTACTGTNFIFTGAYLGSFDPANICTNWIGDSGSSPNPDQPFQVNVDNGQTLVVVVSEVTPDAGCPGYTVTITGLCGGGECQYTISQIGGSIVPGVTDTGNHGDDTVVTIALPFSYTLYDQTFTSINLSSNGNAQFTTTDTTFTNVCLPWSTHNYTIYPYWDDLYLVNSGFGIFTSVSGTAPNRIFNIEWRAQYFPGSGTANFELRLYEGQSRFDIIYGTVTNGNSSATAGVQQNDTNFQQYFCNGAGGSATGGQSYMSSCGTTCTPSWRTEPSIANARRNPAAVAVGSNLYAITGFNAAPDYTAVNERFNGTSWATLAPIPVPHAQSRGTAVGTNIYVPGGFNSVSFGGPLDTMQIYNTTANSWSAGMTLPAARSGVATAAFNGLVYVIAGYNPVSTGHTDVYIYNPGTNSYTTGAPMPAGQGNVPGVLYNGEIYVVGGGTAPGAQYAYNPTTNVWRTIAPLPTSGGTCQSGNGFVQDGELWITGCLGLPINQQVWIYNSGTDSWRAGPPYSVDHQGPGAALFNARGFVVGGGAASGGSTAVESIGSCAPMAQDASSRKVHGAAGTFNIPLPLTGNVGVECRTGPTYQMIIDFPTSVTVQSASVTSGTGNVSSFSGSGTSQITVNLSGVTDQQRITMTLHGVNDGTHMGDVPISMGVLTGDVNGNGAVSAADVALTKSQVGATVSGSNFREDVNANGVLNAVDVAIVKSDVGHALPP